MIRKAHLIALLPLLLLPARGGAAEDAGRRYRDAALRWDVPVMRAVLKELRRSHRTEDLAPLEAQTAYLAGDEAGALRILTRHEPAGEQMRELRDRLKATEPVYTGFREKREGPFLLRAGPGLDEILIPYALPVLRKALAAGRDDLGVQPTEPILVEFWPDVESFATASTLPIEDIHRTGAVAICKFNRIMLTTPRVYLQGYHWADTLAHELTHYLIIKKTGHEVPVWLHEGLAKFEETRWRGLRRPRGLTPVLASLLSEAAREDRLIPFAKMHPSLAKLDSQRDAALAYAECVTFVDYLARVSETERPLAALLDAVAEGRTTEEAIAVAAGRSFEALQREWLAELKADPPAAGPPLVFQPLRTVKGPNTVRPAELDPDLAAEARRFARLGDLLLEAGRHPAAIVEYRKAWDRAGAFSPGISLRLARALVGMTHYDEAARVAAELVEKYPEHVEAWKLAGLVLDRKGRTTDAIEAMHRANRINPFDPEIHLRLADLYRQIGNDEAARTEKDVAGRLAAAWAAH
jgi:tetratricopeptide (TPR) repeat protein